MRTFLHVGESDERKRAQADKQRQAEGQLQNNYRQEAEAFNPTIKPPVVWTVGQKDALSGLSEASLGAGRNIRSVNHIFLQESLSADRIQRQGDDFLCTARSDSNGRPWASMQSVDGDDQPCTPKATCKKCLSLAKRWMEKHNTRPNPDSSPEP